jgi:hypothetical protein
MSYADYQDSNYQDEIAKYQAQNQKLGTNSGQKTSTLGGRNYSEDAGKQAAAAIDATDRAANNAVGRMREAGGISLDLARQRDDNVFQNDQRGAYLKQNLSDKTAGDDRNFKKSEAALDRNKSSDEFTQGRYQLAQNQAQDRSNQEYAARSTAQLAKQAQDADAYKQAQEISAAATLQGASNANQANIAFGEQKTSLARAEAAAKAQVTAALYGAAPQYQGY